MSLAFASEITARDPLFDREVVAARPALLRSALGYVRSRDAAEDLAQTVILKALKNHHLFNQGTNLRAWLQTDRQALREREGDLGDCVGHRDRIRSRPVVRARTEAEAPQSTLSWA